MKSFQSKLMPKVEIINPKGPEYNKICQKWVLRWYAEKVFRNLNLLVKDYQTVITKSLDDKVRLCRPTSTITLKFQVVFTILKVCRSGPNPDFEHFQGCNINKYWSLINFLNQTNACVSINHMDIFFCKNIVTLNLP